MTSMPMNAPCYYARKLTSSVIELISPEVIDAFAVQAMATDAFTLGIGRAWLLDATNVAGSVSPFGEAMAGISSAVKQAKGRGLKKMVFVIPSAIGRAAIVNYLQDCPVDVRIFQTRQEALEDLKVLR